MYKSTIFFTLVLLAYCNIVFAQDEFGRFFTTPRERSQLNELRDKKLRNDFTPDISDTKISYEQAPEAETSPVEGIILNGLVYRTDGKNTAWINQNSTNVGSIQTQFTNIDEKSISSDKVKIQLDTQTEIQLKVGQRYDVISNEMHDITEDAVQAAE